MTSFSAFPAFSKLSLSASTGFSSLHFPHQSPCLGVTGGVRTQFNASLHPKVGFDLFSEVVFDHCFIGQQLALTYTDVRGGVGFSFHLFKELKVNWFGSIGKSYLNGQLIPGAEEAEKPTDGATFSSGIGLKFLDLLQLSGECGYGLYQQPPTLQNSFSRLGDFYRCAVSFSFDLFSPRLASYLGLTNFWEGFYKTFQERAIYGFGLEMGATKFYYLGLTQDKEPAEHPYLPHAPHNGFYLHSLRAGFSVEAESSHPFGGGLNLFVGNDGNWLAPKNGLFYKIGSSPDQYWIGVEWWLSLLLKGGFEMTIGQIPTPLGLEPVSPTATIKYPHGIVNLFAEPMFHVGAMVKKEWVRQVFSEKDEESNPLLSTIFALVNGSDQWSGPEGLGAIFGILVNPWKRFQLAALYFVRRGPTGDPAGLFNTSAVYQPLSWLILTNNIDVGHKVFDVKQAIADSKKTAIFFGDSTTLQMKFHPAFNLVLGVDFFADPQGEILSNAFPESSQIVLSPSIDLNFAPFYLIPATRSFKPLQNFKLAPFFRTDIPWGGENFRAVLDYGFHVVMSFVFDTRKSEEANFVE